jgi:hypothetical protein
MHKVFFGLSAATALTISVEAFVSEPVVQVVSYILILGSVLLGNFYMQRAEACTAAASFE